MPARCSLPASGSLVLELVSPRPLRVWVNGTLALDGLLYWRSYERELRAAMVIPCAAGETALLVEVGERSGWPAGLDVNSPSRNREKVRAALRERHPDVLQLQARVEAEVQAPAVSLCFSPAQFQRDGVTWQQVTMRPIPGFATQAPSTEFWGVTEMPEEPLALSSVVLPTQALECHHGGGTRPRRAPLCICRWPTRWMLRRRCAKPGERIRAWSQVWRSRARWR